MTRIASSCRDLLGRQAKLDFAQRADLVRDDERVVVLQVHLNGVAQVGALGEAHEVLDQEHALDNRVDLLLLHVRDAVRVVLAHNRLLLRKVALAREDELVVDALDFVQVSWCLQG